MRDKYPIYTWKGYYRKCENYSSISLRCHVANTFEEPKEAEPLKISLPHGCMDLEDA